MEPEEPRRQPGDIVDRLLTGQSGFRFPADATDSLLRSVRTAPGATLPPILRMPKLLSPSVEQAEREFDHLHPSMAYIQSEWSSTTPSPIRIHDLDRDVFCGTRTIVVCIESYSLFSLS